MNWSFLKTEILKKRISLSLAILLFFTISFITMLSYQINGLQDSVITMQRYEIQQEQEILNRRIDQLGYNLDQIENNWNMFQQTYFRLSGNHAIISFSEMYLDSVSDLIYLSVIMVKDEETDIIWYNYGSPNYAEYLNLFLNDEINYKEELQIINEDNTRFGAGNRFFVKGRFLYFQENLYLIQIGFHEDIVYNNFISTLDTESLDNIEFQSKAILYSSIVFFLAMIVYGVFLIAIIKWFVLKSFEDFINENGKEAIDDYCERER